VPAIAVSNKNSVMAASTAVYSFRAGSLTSPQAGECEYLIFPFHPNSGWLNRNIWPSQTPRFSAPADADSIHFEA
jgi:hypothetical protein